MIRRFYTLLLFGVLLVLTFPGDVKAEAESLQKKIDATAHGETLKLDNGTYNEKITINKPIRLVGSKEVHLQQSGSDPVITIEADNVIIEDVTVTLQSGNEDGTAILINGNNNTLTHIDIHTDSFGIQLNESDNNTISKIQIMGDEAVQIKDRQHGIDLWASHNNDISYTRMKHVKDGIYVDKSTANIIKHNEASDSRYGYHLMFTEDTELISNQAFDNVSGIYIMGANGTIAEYNTLKNNKENVQSLGLLLFDTIGASITNNKVLHNRIGFLIESASSNELAFNRVEGNYIGVQFKEAKQNNIINNSFVANVVQGQAEKSEHNRMNSNYWGDHLGLDTVGNGKSDLSYKVDPFFLSITDEYPPFQLLYQSPGLGFLEDLVSVPKSEQLVDESPLMEDPLASTNHNSESKFNVLLFSFILLMMSVSIIYMGVKINEEK